MCTIRLEFNRPDERRQNRNVPRQQDGRGGKVEMTMSDRFSSDETFDIGLDTGSSVSDQYTPPFRFTGAINSVEVAVGSDS
jgi:hypothetical protein